MNYFFNFKTLVFTVVLALSALSVNAQWNDNFFQVENDDAFYLDRGLAITISGAGITPQGIGEVPVGSGLLVLMAAGAGYAVARRRRSLRKGAMLLLALAMLLGFTQCKKKLGTINDVTTGKVHVTLRVENDSRIVVDTLNAATNGYAAVSFENGDVMYVGYNKTYVGSLTYDGTDFNGDVNISETVEDEPLYFYFLGGKGFTPTIEGNVATLDISDQATKYPVINFAHSVEVYPSATGNYTARLLNKCAIVKFHVTKPAGYDQAGTCITGMNNLVTVNFDPTTADTDDGFTYSKVNDGAITIPSKIGDVWAILLPQEQVSKALAYSTHCATHKSFTVPQIEANDYKPDGITINLLDNYFTAGDNTKVLFSQGNLQYLGKTGKWRFAEHQYDYMGDGPTSGTSYQGNVTIPEYTKYNASADSDAARDLFGWGTSGYNNKYPYMTSESGNSYYNGSLTDTDYDWGVYHRASGHSTEKIENGGDKEWRLLTRDEWYRIKSREKYVYTRTDNDYMQTKNINCAATVVGAKGVILFPDNWTGDYFRNIRYYESGYNNNVYDEKEWGVMELLGCVFFPAAHVRRGSTMDYNDQGRYWSGTINTQWTRGNDFEFNAQGYITAGQDIYTVRYLGEAVRLVYTVE